jgi:D-alanine-D-alanine ligase
MRVDNGIGTRSEDIESRLRPDWWQTIFDSTYLLTDADAVEDDRLTTLEVEALLAATATDPNDIILDLCCGQGRHCLELTNRGFNHVVGVDASAYLIGVARERASNRGLADVRFEVGDVRHPPVSDLLGRCQVVTLLGNSFGYLETEDADREVLRAAYNLLRPGGLVYLDVADGAWLREHFSPASWEWVAEDKMVCRERKLVGDRLISREIVIDTHKGVEADRTYAERLYSSGRLCDLLREIGFEEVTLVGALGSGGTDPGMMAHRFTVTARRTVTVTVLLGDPSLPDTVKLGGQFNEADFDTVNRMKAALARLPHHRFTFIDSHDPERFFAKHTGDMVLNLCDEGYRNDPRSEALVPAALEALGLPYTGCPPACLVLCYDKAIVRTLAHGVGIPVPAEVSVLQGQPVPLWERFPALVKPAIGDSSVGIDATSVVHDQAALEAAVEARRPYGAILVQEFLVGTEYSVALVGNVETDLRALPVLEVDYSALGEGVVPILGYESKWVAGSPWWDRLRYQAATRDTSLLLTWSRTLFQLLGCRDSARFDWRCGADGTPRLLEVNPNPGWCWDGKMALMAAMEGTSYEEFLGLMIESALRRVAP